MTGIIETLRKDWNVCDTPNEGIYLIPCAKEFFFEVNENTKPEEWVFIYKENRLELNNDSIDVHAKTSADKFIAAYKKAKLDEMDFDKTEEPQNGFKKGGYAKVKTETVKMDFPEDFSQVQETTYIEMGTPKKVVTKRPGRMIKGLTPRLAEKGKIKIGKKGKTITSKNGNQFRPPEKIDHFEVTTMDKNKDGDFILDETIMNIINYDCRAIPVRLPYDDPTLDFLTCYALYEGTSRKCMGDGENAIRNNEIIPCNPETCPHYVNKECKPNGILSVILDCAPTVGGVWKFRTVGWNSINNLISSMEFIRHLTNGILAGLPLVLTLTPKHTTVPGTKTPTLIHMVNLEYRGSLAEMAQAIKQTMDTRALMQYSVKDYEKLAEETWALPEAPEECKDIVEEFYPESIKEAQ